MLQDDPPADLYISEYLSCSATELLRSAFVIPYNISLLASQQRGNRSKPPLPELAYPFSLLGEREKEKKAIKLSA